MTAIVKITGDHVIVYGEGRKVLKRGDLQEISRAELEQWKTMYAIEVLFGDIYSEQDLPRLQARAVELQNELTHVLRGLAECAGVLGVPLDEAFGCLDELPEFRAPVEEPEVGESSDEQSEEVDLIEDEVVEGPAFDPLSLIGGDWDELRAFVAENADPHPGPSRTAHEEWIQENYGGE